MILNGINVFISTDEILRTNHDIVNSIMDIKHQMSSAFINFRFTIA